MARIVRYKNKTKVPAVLISAFYICGVICGIALALTIFSGALIAETSQAVEPNQNANLDNYDFISASKINFFLAIITLVSVLAAGASSVVAYKFYHWRQTIDVTGALTPERWGEYLKDVGSSVKENSSVVHLIAEAVNEHISAIQKVHQTNLHGTKQISEETKALKEMLLAFQTSLDEKDKEISRLKEGYDFKILKNTLAQLVTLHAQCLELMGKNPENKQMSNFELLIRDSIENAGVEIGTPAKGELFSDFSDLVEVIGHTSNPESGLKKGQISEVYSYYYAFKGSVSKTVLKKSKITYHLPGES